MEGFPTTCHIKILDALGKEVLQQYMIGGSSTMQMDLGDLASGVYYVRIETEREVMSLPVVVQR
ncbi:MAG: T9SS type A sorting domain-containing protein [Flavobacteriales bacterium]|nr:T9SS type A sorting domain-containing protein [Flavobacteriales bacterium]